MVATGYLIFGGKVWLLDGHEALSVLPFMIAAFFFMRSTVFVEEELTGDEFARAETIHRVLRGILMDVILAATISLIFILGWNVFGNWSAVVSWMKYNWPPIFFFLFSGGFGLVFYLRMHRLNG
jgi:hypothetical protein